MTLLPVRLSTLLRLSLVYYVVYLTFFVCRADYSESNDLVQYTCGHLNRSVYPVWTSQVQPHFNKLDKNYGISKTFKPVVVEFRNKIAAFDEKYQLSYKTDKAWAAVRIWANDKFGDVYLEAQLFVAYQIAKVKLHWAGSMAPITQYYLDQYEKTWGKSVNSFATKVRLNTSVYWRASKRHSSRLLSLHVVPIYLQITGSLSRNKHLTWLFDKARPEKAVAEVKKVYSILVEKSAEYSSKLQQKVDFIQDEFSNLNKDNKLKKKWKRDTNKIVEVMNGILEDVRSSRKRSTDDETPIDIDNETGTEVEESVPEALDELIEPEAQGSDPEFTASADVEFTESMEIQSTEKESTETESTETESTQSESAETVSTETELTETETETTEAQSVHSTVLTYTSTKTLTVTVVKSGPPPSKKSAESGGPDQAASGAEVASVEHTEENVAKYGEDSSEAQIDFELKYWKSKVDKTLDLAYNSLESDMKDFLNATIAELKDKISSNFTALQLGNFARYKVMNELIAAIDKDSEYIRESGTIIEEPEVDRQIMRDRIKEAYNEVEESMKHVEVNLNEAHLQIMETYFAVVQDTVDVLESFADTTILDFSNRLTGLLEILETNSDFEDELSWSAWKQFHKVKDLIFNIRDSIYNDAEAYKLNPRGRTKPNGLKLWDQYLDNINFHIKFLLTDNDEYLKLVRAKANIAYQQREGLTAELNAKAKAKELAEVEALAKAKAVAEAEEKARTDAIAKEEYLKAADAKVNAANEAYQLQKEEEARESGQVVSEVEGSTEVEEAIVESAEEATEEATEEAIDKPTRETEEAEETVQTVSEEGAAEESSSQPSEIPDFAEKAEFPDENPSAVLDSIEVPILGEIIEETVVAETLSDFSTASNAEDAALSPEAMSTVPTEPLAFDDDNIIEELEAFEDAPEALEATD